MNKKNTFTCLLISFSFFFSTAQTHKGLWMTRGVVQTNTQIINNDPSTGFQLHPEVAVNFSDDWMAGAELFINMRSEIARVGQGLFLRNTFLKAQQNELFAQVFYYQESQRSLQPGGGNNRIRSVKLGPGLGLLHFFNNAVGLEIKMNYNVFRKTSTNTNNQKRNGGFQLNASVQYFFDGKLSADSTEINYKTSKGDWVLGGQIIIGDASSTLSGFYTSNLVQPYIGYFIGDHVLLASGLNISNDNFYQRFILGLSPFGRYYQKIGRKQQLFGEFNIAYNMTWVANEPKYNRSHWSGSAGIAAGYSTWIMPQVSFDLKAGFSQNGLYNEGNKEWLSFRRFDFCIALQAFIIKD